MFPRSHVKLCVGARQVGVDGDRSDFNDEAPAHADQDQDRVITTLRLLTTTSRHSNTSSECWAGGREGEPASPTS